MISTAEAERLGWRAPRGSKTATKTATKTKTTATKTTTKRAPRAPRARPTKNEGVFRATREMQWGELDE